MRRGSSAAASNASRQLVNSFRPGLPDNIPVTRTSLTRQVESSFRENTRATAPETRGAARATRSSPAQGPVVSTVGRENSLQRPGGEREVRTSRVLRAGGSQASRTSTSSAVVTLPPRNRGESSRSSTSERPQRSVRVYQTERSARGNGPESAPAITKPPARSETQSGRRVQRISRPSGETDRAGSPGGQTPGRYTIKNSRGNTGRDSTSYSRRSNSIPDVRRSAPPTSNRSYGSSSRAPSRSYSRPSAPSNPNRSYGSTSRAPSRSYSRPSAPSRSGPPAASRGRSSGRSNRN